MGLDGQGCKCLVGEMTSVQSDNNLRSCRKGCCYPMAIIAMAGYVLSQVGRWIHHGFRKDSFHAGAEAMSVILGDSLIRHHVPEGVCQDPGRPMHSVKVGVSRFQQKIPQGVGIEHAVIKDHWKNTRLQPKAHHISPWSS